MLSRTFTSCPLYKAFQTQYVFDTWSKNPCYPQQRRWVVGPGLNSTF